MAGSLCDFCALGPNRARRAGRGVGDDRVRRPEPGAGQRGLSVLSHRARHDHDPAELRSDLGDHRSQAVRRLPARQGHDLRHLPPGERRDPSPDDAGEDPEGLPEARRRRVPNLSCGPGRAGEPECPWAGGADGLRGRAAVHDLSQSPRRRPGGQRRIPQQHSPAVRHLPRRSPDHGEVRPPPRLRDVHPRVPRRDDHVVQADEAVRTRARGGLHRLSRHPRDPRGHRPGLEGQPGQHPADVPAVSSRGRALLRLGLDRAQDAGAHRRAPRMVCAALLRVLDPGDGGVPRGPHGPGPGPVGDGPAAEVGTAVNVRVPAVMRFTLAQRIEHFVLIISFNVLAFTGLPQKYFYTGWAERIITLLGGIERTRVIHRAFALLLIGEAVVHVGAVAAARISGRDRGEMGFSFGDVRGILGDIGYLLGLRAEKPAFGRYDYRQKFEYWAVVWGTIIMAATGLIMWLPEVATRWLPGILVPAARVAHGGEALLAILAVIIWHFYNAHFRPDIFPMDPAMWSGEITLERLRQDHRAEYERLTAGNGKQETGSG